MAQHPPGAAGPGAPNPQPGTPAAQPFTSSSNSYTSPATPYVPAQAPYAPYAQPPADPTYAAYNQAPPPGAQFPPGAYGATPFPGHQGYPPQGFAPSPYAPYPPHPQNAPGMYAQPGAPMAMPPAQGYAYPPQGYPPTGYDPSAAHGMAPQYNSGGPYPGYGQPPPQSAPMYGQPDRPMPMVGGTGSGGNMDVDMAANNAFSQADTSRNDHIDVRGFIVALRAFGVNLEYKDMLTYFERADHDQSGHITRQEFVNLCKYQLVNRRQLPQPGQPPHGHVVAAGGHPLPPHGMVAPQPPPQHK